MLAARGLTCGYGAVTVLEGIDLEVRAGEWLALLGPVGAGKTTLLGALAGLLRPAAGSMAFDNQPIDRLPPHQRLRRGLALVPEGRRLFAGMTVRENLLAGTHALDDAARRAVNLKQVFELFPVLAERQRQIAGTLSGGEQQMCAIGRALMGSPRLLMIDEVTLGLAPIVVATLFGALAHLHRQGMTLLTVEQNVPLALEYADRACIMNAGRMVMEGPAERLRTDPDLPRHFLGY
jgi:branched-chain amino acid transport system ATP-binding protein